MFHFSMSAACIVGIAISLQVCITGAVARTAAVGNDVLATEAPPGIDLLQQGSVDEHPHFHAPRRRPLIRNSLEGHLYLSATLVLGLIFSIGAFLTLGFVVHSLSSKHSKMRRASYEGSSLHRSEAMEKRGTEDTAGSKPLQGATPKQRQLLRHLKQGSPLHAYKATSERDVAECNLPSYIKRYFEHNPDSMEELIEVLHQRCQGETAGDNWWSWSHPKTLSTPMHELMSQFHCDGLLDWSCLPSSALAYTYFQIIVTSGLGPESMMHEGSDEDWLNSLHRDIFWDTSLRGLKHLFFSKVDTLIVGCLGRKRIVLLPPKALPGEHTRSSHINWPKCDAKVEQIRKMPCLEGWTALEKYAESVGGKVVTVCPGTYCHIPADWWHIVRPLDDLTAILTPSFLQGCWARSGLVECISTMPIP